MNRAPVNGDRPDTNHKTAEKSSLDKGEGNKASFLGFIKPIDVSFSRGYDARPPLIFVLSFLRDRVRPRCVHMLA